MKRGYIVSIVVKHVLHIGDLADIPIADILIERGCISDGCIFEHTTHISNVTHLPTADILIERVCSEKHGGHIGDLADIPQARYPD